MLISENSELHYYYSGLVLIKPMEIDHKEKILNYLSIQAALFYYHPSKKQ